MIQEVLKEIAADHAHRLGSMLRFGELPWFEYAESHGSAYALTNHDATVLSAAMASINRRPAPANGHVHDVGDRLDMIYDELADAMIVDDAPLIPAVTWRGPDDDSAIDLLAEPFALDYSDMANEYDVFYGSTMSDSSTKQQFVVMGMLAFAIALHHDGALRLFDGSTDLLAWIDGWGHVRLVADDDPKMLAAATREWYGDQR
jgi:hypothetical protein